MSNAAEDAEGRVLVVAPTAKDARISQALFSQAGLPCAICSDLHRFGQELEKGIGVVVLTEEALVPERHQFLLDALATQPTWSDLPIILLAGTSPRQLLSVPSVQALGNVLVLERPIGMQTLLGIVQMGLRTRRRQYAARLVAEAGQLLGGSLGDKTTLTALTALMVPRLADCCLLYTIDAETICVAALSVANLDIQTILPERAVAVSASSALVEEHLQVLGASASLVVPLQLNRRLLGILSLGMLTAERRFGAEDTQAASEIAERLALALDQARLYQAEHQARAEAEAAVRAHDELMALISHDLNNPLTAVLGQAQFLQRQIVKGTLVTERMVRGVTSIEQVAKQMQVQIAELLDTARRQAGQPLAMHREATDLVALAHTAVAGIQLTTERHQIRVQTQLPSLIIALDSLRMKRVLDNLLSNAVKYSPEGAVTLSIDVETAEAVRWAVVRVHDNGIGIPADDLPHIFERFRRAANAMDIARGEGLGLASVRQITEEHGGRITVTSEINKGATFTIYLPLTIDPSQ